jgi:hypothetical protein
VPSSQFTPTTLKTLVSSPTDSASSGSGSEHRTVTYAELATDQTQLKSSRTCHQHVTLLSRMNSHKTETTMGLCLFPLLPEATRQLFQLQWVIKNITLCFGRKSFKYCMVSTWEWSAPCCLLANTKRCVVL